MLDALNTTLASIAGFIWGPAMIIILLGAGLVLTLYHRFVQFRGFKRAIQITLGKFDEPGATGEVSHFKALCTALSATVGLGNIAGVAIAISLGGPGATIWMILVGLVGMATKFNECTLACMYREKDPSGQTVGGPMFYIRRVPAGKLLAFFYAFFLLIGAYGAANLLQANQVKVAFENSFSVPPVITGTMLAVLTGIVIIGGVKRIAGVAGVLVPVMAVLYVIGCLAVIFTNIEAIPSTLSTIIEGAFSGTAATGGFVGATISVVITQGVRRALFSSEAGLGTAAIAHSMAKTDRPASEGLVALLEPFIDTIVICTMTALAINITGAWQLDLEPGVAMTQAALDAGIPNMGRYFIPVAVFMFAFSTLISWSLYGEQATKYLFKNSKTAVWSYRLLWTLCPIAGALWSILPIVNLADICLGLMVIPNVFAFIFLTKGVRREVTGYLAELKDRAAQ